MSVFNKSGIILIDKEANMTSHDVVEWIKKNYQVKKIGHAGTLDPSATGLLVVLINQATKMSDYLLNDEKEYLFKIQFLYETDSLDNTGNVIKTDNINKSIAKKEIMKVIEKYNGYIYDQEPPLFSAIKINGKKLLDYSLQGKTEGLKVEKRTVKLNKMTFHNYNKKRNEVELSVICSKGTYIRSLARDIAYDLNTYGTITYLRRISSGKFHIANAKKMNEIQQSDLISLIDTIKINEYPMVVYPNEKEIINGKRIQLVNYKEDDVFFINKKYQLLGIYQRVVKDIFACKRGFLIEEGSEFESE